MLENILTVITVILSIVLIPFSLYQFFVGIHYFKKGEKFRNTEKFNKFAILVAARNEENVIGKLIDSLNNMNYPKDKYEIIVAPNNCSDNTKDAAIKAGARIFDAKGKIRNKGDVLHQMFDYLIEKEDHDAYIIFDADNIVNPNFLSEMNIAIENGYSAAQGFRDSKNPYESATSGAYTLYHYMINTFYNHPRTTLKINNMIVGCGFMATRSIIEELGGWNTETITEDLEFTVMTTLHGSRIAYCENAIFFDEQPNSFLDSWHQRIRWQMGVRQGLSLNFRPILREIFREGKIKRFDTLAMLSANMISNLSLVSMILGTFLVGLKTTYTMGLTFFGLNIMATIIGPSLFAILILAINKRPILKMWKGILFFGVFLASWVPINLYVSFVEHVEWKEMKHNSKVKVNIE